jgi:hypothetical protein
VARGTPTRLAARLAVLAGLVAVLVAVVPPTAVAAADRLPDLRVAAIADLRIQTVNGHRYLRFTSLMANLGKGPFEVRSQRPNTASPFTVDQLIYNDAGGSRRVRTDATLRYAGDGHDHWHVRRMMSYHLWSNQGTERDSKIGFCFFDTTPRSLSLPGAPRTSYYRESWCGGRSATSTRTGISVGWGDKYPWNFSHQWIDITGLPGGTYTLRNVVDLYGSFDEVSETNNCAWARVRFGSSGSTVTRLATGTSCINDWSTSPFANHIAWAYEQGIVGGCDVDLFCTYNPITRGELATMLARTMGLPAATQDYFSDDNGSTHERSINRLAEAGLTGGCGAGRFCPGATLTRAEMASFLVRALELPAATADYFQDDNGKPHEGDINALAESGLTGGCAPQRFCPAAPVTRGQTAAFLHRGFGSDPDPEPEPEPTP